MMTTSDAIGMLILGLLLIGLGCVLAGNSIYNLTLDSTAWKEATYTASEGDMIEIITPDQQRQYIAYKQKQFFRCSPIEKEDWDMNMWRYLQEKKADKK